MSNQKYFYGDQGQPVQGIPAQSYAQPPQGYPLPQPPPPGDDGKPPQAFSTQAPPYASVPPQQYQTYPDQDRRRSDSAGIMQMILFLLGLFFFFPFVFGAFLGYCHRGREKGTLEKVFWALNTIFTLLYIVWVVVVIVVVSVDNDNNNCRHGHCYYG